MNILLQPGVAEPIQIVLRGRGESTLELLYEAHTLQLPAGKGSGYGLEVLQS
jgi:hypothetical protein